jgi:hypothetical protein
LQLSLFDERNLAEITAPDYPGERLVVCRNPDLARERARKRHRTRSLAHRCAAAAAPCAAAGSSRDRACGRGGDQWPQMAKHFALSITKDSFS